MTNCEQELAQLKHYQATLQRDFQKLADELARLFKVSHDEKSLLGCARIVLEILLKQICKEVNLTCANSEMVGSILSKFREKTKNIVPDIVPDDIYRSMDHINGLATPGAHDKEYDPKQIREVLVALERVLHWYVVKFKQWQIPLQDTVTTAPIADIKRLPEPLTELIGREQELQQIQRAFEQSETFLAIIVAAGGIGKSALSDAWLKSIQPHYQGVQWVFAWSFYSQGAHDTQTSAAPFFQVALPFFGWTGELPKDDIAQGRALAKLLSQQSFILILDGLEPLQHPAHILDGELKDTGLHALFSAIRREGLAHSPSLILISSRQPLQELEAWETRKYVMLDLQTLPNHDGAKLLKKLGVRGTEVELQQATQEMGGHALAVVLLGKLLKEKFAGRVERRDQLPPLWEERKQGAHARRVLQFYDDLWRRSFWQRLWQGESPERTFLYLLGLFDRPMELREKEILVKQAKWAAPLRRLNDVAWEHLETRLKTAGILLSSDGFQWDCHPLIRDYFAQQFNTRHPAEFRQAHLVLFEYYQQLPEKQQPDTLAELEPLYRAMVHGCLAGEYFKALDAVYRDRILRWQDKENRTPEYYSLYKLGAYSQDLTALAAFFPHGWSQPVQQGLSETDQAWLLAVASFCLMSLGRLTEAVEPGQANLAIYVKIEQWKYAAITAQNLVDLLLPLGRLEEATAATQVIDYAEKSEDLFEQTLGHAYRATVLHCQGQSATEAFETAEQLQQQYDPDSPQLYSLPGFWHCAWLLDQPDVDLLQVVARGEYILNNAQRVNNLLSIALGQLTLARAYCQLGEITQATDYFEKAVSGIRKAGKANFLPEFLIDRANFYLQQQQLEQAQQDLDEAWQIIEHSGMKLYAVDYHLAMCRYARLQQPSEAAGHLEKAKILIKTTGYHLRDKDVRALSAP